MPFSRHERELARQSIETLRLLAVDAVEKAASGHPGTPMEAAPLAYLIYRHHLRHSPANPSWPGRDRFVLSCGHASMLLYGILHLTGYDLSLEDLKLFRQLGSRTPGHPEFGHTPGVETTTGPLGQGLAAAVGMALGGRFLAQQVSPELFDYHVYALCSDGDLMEGVASEAASLAGHLQLGNLTALYLDNRITIEGSTDLAFSEEVATRFLAYGWRIEHAEGENLLEIDAALARSRGTEQPTLIIVRSHIAFGAPTKQDTAEAHGAPLGQEEVRRIKELLGRDPDAAFVVPDAVRRHLSEAVDRGEALEREWQEHLSALRCKSPTAYLLDQVLEGGLPAGWDSDLPVFTPADGTMPTHKASGLVLNALARRLPLLLGGSADLAPSNNTELKGEDAFAPGRSGRNIHFGVREHAMGATLNGLAHTPGLIPYGGTFLVFSDYMRPPIRLAAIMGLGVIYVFTHDSIGLGEDGPTHQPVEHLPALRAIPNLTVIRPADANETREAWRLAVANRRGPTALILSRQSLPVLAGNALSGAEGVRFGGYVLAREEAPLQGILLASGSEIHPALAAREQLQRKGFGIRVVSFPCWELFEAQDRAYRDEVLPPDCPLRVAVEAASPFGWERYVGSQGAVIGLSGFGASAPGEAVMEHFGLSAEAIRARVEALLTS